MIQIVDRVTQDSFSMFYDASLHLLTIVQRIVPYRPTAYSRNFKSWITDNLEQPPTPTGEAEFPTQKDTIYYLPLL